MRQNVYYIRRPGPSSDQPRTAQEWNALIGRCVRADREHLLDSIRSILLRRPGGTANTTPEKRVERELDEWATTATQRWKKLVAEELPDEESSRYANGVWIVTYALLSDHQPPGLREFREILRKVEGHETGWPPWWVPTRAEIEPIAYQGSVECWLHDTRFPDPAHSDFWRASPEGKMFLLRGYDEDRRPARVEPGTVLDPTMAVWRIGECLLHPQRLAVALSNAPVAVIFKVKWEGLADRILQFARPVTTWLSEHRCRQSSVTSRITVSSDQIGETLPEIVGTVLEPLFEAFGFYSMPPEVIQHQLAEMRGRTR